MFADWQSTADDIDFGYGSNLPGQLKNLRRHELVKVLFCDFLRDFEPDDNAFEVEKGNAGIYTFVVQWIHTVVSNSHCPLGFLAPGVQINYMLGKILKRKPPLKKKKNGYSSWLYTKPPECI